MTSIYVRGFPKKVGERDLEKYFESCGVIGDVRMVRDFAFIVLLLIIRHSKIDNQE